MPGAFMPVQGCLSLWPDFMSCILDILSSLGYTRPMKTFWTRSPLARRLVAYYAVLMLAEVLVPHVPHALYGVLAIAPLLLLRRSAHAQ